MKAEGRLMQTRFIEIYHFSQTNKVGYFSDRVVYYPQYEGLRTGDRIRAEDLNNETLHSNFPTIYA